MAPYSAIIDSTKWIEQLYYFLAAQGLEKLALFGKAKDIELAIRQ